MVLVKNIYYHSNFVENLVTAALHSTWWEDIFNFIYAQWLNILLDALSLENTAEKDEVLILICN